jgi:hypothetical protein
MRIDLKANRRRRDYRECGCIFGLCSKSSSSTTSYQQQVGASEGSLAIGAGGKFVESGGVSVDSGGDVRLGGQDTTLTSGGPITITTSDPELLNNALDKYAELSAGFGSSLNQFVSKASEDQDKKVATLVATIEKGKESEDTAAQNRKIFLYLALGFVALLVFFGWRKG